MLSKREQFIYDFVLGARVGKSNFHFPHGTARQFGVPVGREVIGYSISSSNITRYRLFPDVGLLISFSKKPYDYYNSVGYHAWRAHHRFYQLVSAALAQREMMKS